MRKIVIVAFITAAIFVGAELPPNYYEEMKQKAPEHLKIVVEASSDRLSGVNEKRYTIRAKVLEVLRSDTGLKKNDTITISYRRIFKHPVGWVGPSDPIVLEERGVYDVYLRRYAEVYSSAARGWSFRRIR